MSSPMIAWVPLLNRLQKYLTVSPNAARSIDLPPVEIHDLETAPERRPRTLKHLLKANHVNYSILYHGLEFHNHMPHLLGSAYLLGADVAHLQRIYDEESKDLEEWEDSPAEVTETDWRSFLGQRIYQRAYVDFFEDELALKFGYEWKKVIEEFMLEGSEPLIHGLIGGIGHPLIHLAYAYELSSKELAIEALAMTATSYNYLHKYLDDVTYSRPSTYSTTSTLEILQRVRHDSRFDKLFSSPGNDNIHILFALHETLILEHWNAWIVADPIKQFQESQEVAVSLLLRTVKSATHAHDFFLAQVLTTSHAVRVLLPHIPRPFHVPLVRAWLLLTLALYIAQLRPEIGDGSESKPTRTWKDVEEKAVCGPYSMDAHYVKALRAIQTAAATWGDVHEHYLGSALEFADGFRGWTGFGS